jgi:uncharacterized protein
MAPRIIYITGFRQHAGKTVASLGLLHLLRRDYKPEELGYIKPVGQELVEIENGIKVDKDALVIREFCDIPDLDMEYISPVRLGSGFTKNYITSENREEETNRLVRKIEASLEHFRHKKVIIAEGTGHPGVGGIVGLSNAVVGNLMKADILFLSGGGIGKALDMLEVDLTYFMYAGSNVRGIVFNKLIPEKIATVKQYISEDLINSKYGKFPEQLNIFGYLPELTQLSRPSMRVLLGKFPSGRAIGNPEDKSWIRDCRHIKVLSLAAEFLHPEEHIQPGDIVLLGAASRSRRSKLLMYQRALGKGKEIAGIVLTCGHTTPLDPLIEEQVLESGIPAIYVQEDTAAAEEKIIQAFETSKIQVYDSLKYQTIKKLFSEHFDYPYLKKMLGV